MAHPFLNTFSLLILVTGMWLLLEEKRASGLLELTVSLPFLSLASAIDNAWLMCYHCR